MHLFIEKFNPIRSTCFSPLDNDVLIIGGMDGSLYQWKFMNHNSKPEIIETLEKTITCIKFHSNLKIFFTK